MHIIIYWYQTQFFTELQVCTYVYTKYTYTNKINDDRHNGGTKKNFAQKNM